MNRKLEDLMYQAGLTAQGCWDEMDGYGHEAIEKFAELIVQECADLAYSHNIYSRGRPWNLIIKEHFGQAITDADIPPYLRDTK